MKILLDKNAFKKYIEFNTDYLGNYYGEEHLEIILKEIQGKEVEINTEMLFKNEFIVNLKTGTSNSSIEIRIPDIFVEKVINDIRHGKAKCDFCNQISNNVFNCTSCGKNEYLEVFFDEDLYK